MFGNKCLYLSCQSCLIRVYITKLSGWSCPFSYIQVILEVSFPTHLPKKIFSQLVASKWNISFHAVSFINTKLFFSAHGHLHFFHELLTENKLHCLFLRVLHTFKINLCYVRHFFVVHLFSFAFFFSYIKKSIEACFSIMFF